MGLTPPLASPGRGRLSREGLAAIEQAHSQGMVFDDDPGVKPVAPSKPKPAPKPAESKALGMQRPKNTQVRNLTEAPYGYTVNGDKVEFITCAECHYHVNLCDCKGGPKAPKMVVRLPKDSPCVLYL